MEKLSPAQIKDRLAGMKRWQYDGEALTAQLQFTDFREAFAMMTRIAFECELQNHHPDWSNVYNRLQIRLNTHDAGGVTTKDFQLAKTIDALID